MRSWLICYALLYIPVFGTIILYSCWIYGNFNYSFQTSDNQQDHSGTTSWKGWWTCGSGSIYPTILLVVWRCWWTARKSCKYFLLPDQELSPNPPAYAPRPLPIYQEVSPHVTHKSTMRSVIVFWPYDQNMSTFQPVILSIHLPQQIQH
jgi:hypothetical protein